MAFQESVPMSLAAATARVPCPDGFSQPHLLMAELDRTLIGAA